MTTTPAGLPAWTRTATAATYGGDAGKRDLGGIGKVNAKTDISAADWLRMASDCARAVRTAPLFFARITVAYSSSVSVTSATVQPMWGDAATYSTTPPSDYYPTFSGSGSTLSLTFPNCSENIDGDSWLLIPDEFGVVGQFQLTSVERASTGSIGVASIASRIGVSITSCTTNGAVIYLVVW